MTETRVEPQNQELSIELVARDIREVLDGPVKDHPSVASSQMADKISGYCFNTGQYQLQRILGRTGEDIDKISGEIVNNESLSGELWKSDKPIRSFLENFRDNSVLFESLVDGNGSFSRFIATNFPLLRLYTKDEILVNSLATQDYTKGDPGPFGIDWSLLGKSLIRVSKNINSLQSGNVSDFCGKVDEAKFGDMRKIWGTLESSGLSPVFITAALHLDIAKGGSVADKKYWAETGINAFVHNEASAKLVKESGILARVMNEFGSGDLSWEEREKVTGLFENIIAYHGYIGQWARGEVTEHVLEGFTKWVSENKDALESSLTKLGITESLSDFVSNTYYLVNVIDTASVRDGLYTDKLDDQFTDFKLQLKSVLEGSVSWNDVMKQRLEAVSERGEKKSEILADRLTKLRGGKDYEEALGTLLELGEDKVNYVFDLLEHSQLWYVENATSNFSVENQLKLLVLISRIAKEKGVDEFGNFDVNFAPLMNTLRPNGVVNKALTRTIDTALYGLSWSEVTDTPNRGEIKLANGNLTIELTGEHEITGINCVLNEKMAEACDLINAYYMGKRETSDDPKQIEKFMTAVDSLTEWTGIKLDEWDRVFDQEIYIVTMNTTMPQKVDGMSEIIEEAKSNGKKVLVVGLGSGSGELEHALAVTGKLGKEDMVIGTDISRAMVENMKRISRVIRANSYLNPDSNSASMTAVLADASQINRKSFGVIEDENTVVIYSIYSVGHEFASYKDGFKYGDFTTSVFENIMSKDNLKVGDEIAFRDPIQPDNPKETVRLKIGNATGNEIIPSEFLHDFIDRFEGFTDSEKEEIRNLPEDLSEGTEIQITRGLTMEIMGHFSWLKDGKNLKEMHERYGYFDAEGFKNWFTKIAEKNEIKIEIEIDSQPAGYEKYIGGRLDVLDPDGKPLPVPLNMATIRIKRVG